LAGKTFISDIRKRLEKESRSFPMKGSFLVDDKQVPLNKNGNPYLSLVLKDRDGTISAKMWDNVTDTQNKHPFSAGDFVMVECEAQLYRNQPQLKIKKLKKIAPPDPDELADFLGSVSIDIQKMMDDLQRLIESLHTAPLRDLLMTRLADESFRQEFSRCPAAKTNHHAHIGGLLQHTLSVMRLADAICGNYPELDRDLLVAGAFLHDVGKMREIRTDSSFSYSDEGNLIGHLVIGAQMFEQWCGGHELDATYKLKLVHMILSHHGKREFGSPVVPKFPEALALHFLDNLDSKLQSMFEVARQQSGQKWSSFQPQFEGYLFLDSEATKVHNPDRNKNNEQTLRHRPLAGLADELAKGDTVDLFQPDNNPAKGEPH